MAAILVASHNDDESLFAFYQCLRHKPKVHVIFRSYRQWTQQNGPSWRIREAETDCAMQVAGCEWVQHDGNDLKPDGVLIADGIARIIDDEKPTLVIAPAWEMGGHDDHNMVASIVHGIEGDFKRVEYLTYRRGHGRSQNKAPIIGTAEEEEMKLRALLCYKSQIEHAATADWFPGGPYDDMREWVQ
jgi:LmbE family N-acetylglucosaminyl deacetylase